MWFWYAIFSALVSAISIILNKKALKNINASLLAWSLFAFSIPILIYPALKDGWPTLNLTFVIATLLSVLIFTFTKTLSLRSLKNSKHISEIIPLAFFSVFIQYILGLVFLNEKTKLLAFFGLTLIIFGGYYLNIQEAKEDLLRPFKIIFADKDSFYYLLAMLIIPVSSLFDKVGLLNIRPINQSFLLFWENLLTTILLTGYMTHKDRHWLKDLKTNFIILLSNGVIYVSMVMLFFYAITTGSLALTTGIKRLEILFALLIGWFLFKDKPKKEVWIGSLIMLLGVILIKIG
jgi:uncharacterized membrane protein